MEKASFDLPALCKWGVDKALEHGEVKTGLPLGEVVSPLAYGLIKSLGIEPLAIDPVLFLMGRLVIAGMDKQKKLVEAKNASTG